MGKSPAKWIKGVLFGKKSSKANISKGREKVLNEKEVVVPTRAAGTEFSSDPPLAFHHNTNTIDSNKGSELENKEAPSILGDGGSASPGTEIQGSLLQDAISDPEKVRQEKAATMAQAAFRGYLARRAFWALKGIIRLQALIRGHLVRRQAVATLCSMAGIIKFQALTRGRRVRQTDIGLEVQKGCSLVSLEGKLAAPVTSTQMAKLSANVFICKLLAPSPTVMPLCLQYEPGDPNSVSNWLERWSATHFWKPIPKPRKVPDSKSQRKHLEAQTGRIRKSVRRVPSTNVENVSAAAATSEFEKPKRNLRKVTSHPAEPVQENPQVDLEKVKRNLRKVHSPRVENPAQTEVDTEVVKQGQEKESSTSVSDVLEGYTNNSCEKLKKEPVWISSNQPEREIIPEPSATQQVINLTSGDQAAEDLKPLTETTDNDIITPNDEAAVESNILTESNGKDENMYASNGVFIEKEDITTDENQKSSRKASTPAKQERSENGLQSSPALPSYMQATQSAKAKLRAQGSPKLAQEVSAEKVNSTRRHSLPSSTNSKISSQSPRTQRLVQTGSKGGNKNDKALSASRDGNGKVAQAEWRR